jgi:predicted nuclease with RNAse H fold
MPVNVPPNEMFRRWTDYVVKKEIKRQPLDVGADRIARTALAALRLLQELRVSTGSSIPLAWNQALKEAVSAIEVYPAATLSAYGIVAQGYKEREQDEQRKVILKGLGKHVVLPDDVTPAESNADILDAVVCVLAAADFLRGETIQPTNRELAEKEGWIWVRSLQFSLR